MSGHAGTCEFPTCPEKPVTETGMCGLHARVTVSGSWVNDKHGEQGHG